jgi:hypothetical protein
MPSQAKLRVADTPVTYDDDRSHPLVIMLSHGDNELVLPQLDIDPWRERDFLVIRMVSSTPMNTVNFKQNY